MKNVVRFFGLPLSVLVWLLSGSFPLFIALGVLSQYLPPPIWGLIDNLGGLGGLVDEGGRILSLATAGLGVTYLFIGIVAFLAGTRKKNTKESRIYAKRMVLRGAVGVGISFLLYFVLHVILGFFGFLPTGLPLPVVMP